MKYTTSFIAAMTIVVCPSSGFADDGAEPTEARQVLDLAIEAMGGRAAIESVESARFVLSTDDDDPARMIAYWSAPDIFLMVARSESTARITGRSGDRMWEHSISDDESTLRIMPAQALSDRYRASTEYHRLLINLADSPALLPETRRGTIGDRPVIRVRAIYDDGRTETASFCAERLELIQLDVFQEGWDHDPRKARAVTTYEEWADAGPIRLFQRTAVRFDGRTTHYRVQASFNRVAPEIFEFPDSVLKSTEQELDVLDRDRTFVERLSLMHSAEVRAELTEVAKRRAAARGTRAEEELIRQFALLMNRLRKLRASEDEGVTQRPGARRDVRNAAGT